MESLIFTYEGYKNTNIGDYIQSLAAKQFWDSTNIQYYHRDKLNQYSGASAKVIMNGLPINPKTGLLHPIYHRYL